MKVLHTIHSLRPETGGPARSVPGLAAALAAAGMDVHLWSPEAWPASGDAQPFTPHHGDLGDVIRRIGPVDLVHDHGLWLPVNHKVAVLCRNLAVPRVVSPRGMLEPWALNHKRWKKRLAWSLYQRSDLQRAAVLHATAESEAGQFRKLGLKVPVHVIPNGIETPADTFSEKTTGDGGPKTALFLSRIHSKKGLPMLIDAWAEVRPTGWRMRVVGPDENGHRAELEAQVAKAGLGGIWEFVGALEGTAKAREFHSADLFILPTHSENFGIAVAEALAAGVPVITTTGAPWSGLETHRCGWWVEPSAGALAAALQEASGHAPDELRDMGRRGAEWTRAEFAWPAIAARMEEVYQSTLAPK